MFFELLGCLDGDVVMYLLTDISDEVSLTSLVLLVVFCIVISVVQKTEDWLLMRF